MFIAVSMPWHFKFLLLILLLHPIFLFGNPDKQPSIKFSLFEDTTANLSVAKVQKIYQQKHFKQVSQPSFNPGYTESVFWLAVETKDLNAATEWLLTIDNPHINILEWYEVSGHNVRLLYQTGDFFPFKQRPFPEFTNFAIPLIKSDGYFLLKVDKRRESLQAPMRVLTYKELSGIYIKGNLINGLLSGTVILMIFFSIVLWITTRRKLYLFYGVYIGALLFWIWSNKGLGFEYLWPHSSFFPSRARPVGFLLTIIFNIQFMQLFIGQTKSSRFYYPNKILQVFSIIFLLLVLAPINYRPSLITFKYTQTVLITIASLHHAIVLLSAAEKILKGINEAKFHLAAMLVLYLSGLAEQLYMYGTIMLNYYAAQFALLGGLVVEAAILLYGLAQKFNRYRKERLTLLFEKNQQQKILTDTIVNVQEKERRIFADRLHDEIGAMLSVVALHLNSLRKNKQSVDSETKLEKADEMLSQVADTVRTMSHQISPVTIEKLGFVNALESLIQNINNTEKLYIEFVCMGFEDATTYNRNFLNSIYRIVQELLQNMIKHSQATNGIIQLIAHEDIIVIMAEDNGLGLTKERMENPLGSGMSSIFSKVDYLQGRIEIETPGNGTLINIELPNLDTTT